jgi:hypothetical protein
MEEAKETQAMDTVVHPPEGPVAEAIEPGCEGVEVVRVEEVPEEVVVTAAEDSHFGQGLCVTLRQGYYGVFM